jgi:serine beta-lactamase-like protein LACTB, mitochondrial
VAVVAIGIALTAFLGLWGYMAATPPLHPNAQDIQSVAESEPPPRWAPAVAEARQIVRAALAEQSLPGVSVAVAAGGHIVWAEGFGWADMTRQVPVAPHTQFRIGTASVPLTSAAAGLLLEQKRIFLDDEIQRHVPEYPEHQWPVTLRQLMGHVAGIPNDGGDEGPLLSQRCERPVDALQFLSGHERELAFEPGTRFQFSSYGWVLVSAAIEAAAGEPFLAYMRKHVFAPLGMNDTVADSATEAMPERATPYFPRFAADPRYGLHPMRPLDYSCYAGASVFLSTPSDLVRFALAMDSGTFLPPDTVRLLRTPQRLASGEETGYGLGWDIETVTLAARQTTQIGHDGDLLGGQVASLLTYPDHGIVVSVISNIAYADTSAVGIKVADAFAAHK